LGRIGFYYAHYECLGHTSRLLSLLRVLKKRISSDFYFIQASLPHSYLRFPSYVKILPLPFSLFTRRSFYGDYEVNKEVLLKRAIFLSNLVKKIDFSVFITEFFPLGRNLCKYELLPVLSDFKKKGKPIFSSAGYPVISKKSIADFETFVHFYKKIFIHSPKEEMFYISELYKNKIEREKYLNIFEKYSHKIVFTGYLLPSKLKFKEPVKLNFKQNKIKVLVTRGGGAYYPKIISCAIKASDLLNEKFHFIIVAGPSTSQKEWRYFCSLFSKKVVKNASLVKYASNLKDLLRESHVCISTGSYNTCVAIIYFKKRAILIPFKGYKKNGDYKEQIARAKLLRDIMGVSVLDYFSLTPLKLKKEIEKSLIYSMSEKAVSINKEWFCDEELFLKEFLSFLDKDLLK